MKKNPSLLILTLGHFIIDFSCLYFYFSNFAKHGIPNIISSALLYNFLAFALQAPLGFFFDKFPAKHISTLGTLLVLGGYFAGICHLPSAGLILCGFGNAFFHIGGSIGIVRTDCKGLRDAGIFVSSGALGVSLGTYFAHNTYFDFAALVILLLLIVLLIAQQTVTSPGRQTVSSLPAKTNATLLLLTLFAVLIRSLGGLFFPTSYKEYNIPFLAAVLPGTAAFLGKFLGGFLSHFCTNVLHKALPDIRIDLRTGNYIFGTLTLLLSSILLTFGGHLPFLCFLGILCFHTAMPVTLFELYCILPDRPGFAMGLSTVMLFLGYLPHEFFSLEQQSSRPILYILTLTATCCMVASLWIYRRAARKGNCL